VEYICPLLVASGGPGRARGSCIVSSGGWVSQRSAVARTNIKFTYIYTNSLYTCPFLVNEISSPPDFNGYIALLYIFL